MIGVIEPMFILVMYLICFNQTILKHISKSCVFVSAMFIHETMKPSLEMDSLDPDWQAGTDMCQSVETRWPLVNLKEILDFELCFCLSISGFQVLWNKWHFLNVIGNLSRTFARTFLSTFRVKYMLACSAHMAVFHYTFIRSQIQSSAVTELQYIMHLKSNKSGNKLYFRMRIVGSTHENELLQKMFCGVLLVQWNTPWGLHN